MTAGAAGRSGLAGRTVTVVGAGVGGAATALLCARAGADVLLLERLAEPKAVGAGILLQPNGLAVLYGLGLEAALRAHGCVARDAEIVDAAGRRIVRTPVPDFGAGIDHALCLRRSRLLGVLADAIAAEPRIRARFGAEVTTATPDGRVAWRDVAGPGGEVGADLVVGADGLHSRVREGGAFTPRRRPGHLNLRVIAPVPAGDGFVERWTALGICGEGPVDGGTYLYAAVVAPEVRAACEARDPAALTQLYQAACPPAARVLRAVERFDDVLLNQVIRIDCQGWVDGRLVLVGDAAHAMAPNLGQGANSALVDAAVLVDALAAGGPEASVLQRWARRRRPAVRRVQDVAGALARVSNVRHAGLRRVRDAALRLLARLDDGARGVRAVQQEDPAGLRRVVEALGR